MSRRFMYTTTPSIRDLRGNSGNNNRLATPTTTSHSIEEPLCNYLSSFDGTKKDFTDIQQYFDALYSDDLIHIIDGGRPINKHSLVCINKHLLEKSMVATLEDLYFVNDHIVEYTVHWGNDYTSLVTHLIACVEDGKIVLVKPCQETNGAFASMECDCDDRDDGSSLQSISSNNRANRTLGRLRDWSARKS